ncbi:MAG: type II toxin-antitoxin system RelE/ParE family toxin [Cyanobacteria bacterium SBLK]|nr:type II toxin-antitoxin system RelE/ParE family toxin [Cyanobacteria bacterium SBLK]
MSYYSFSDKAIRDLDAICSYIAENDPRAASKLFDKIRQKCKSVANFPNMGKSYEQFAPGLRGFIVNNYIIFYYPQEEGINVVKIASGYQDLQSLFSDRE